MFQNANPHIQHLLWIVVLLLGLLPITQAQGTTHSAGYAIIIQGSSINHKGEDAYNKTLNRVYQRLLDRGFTTDDIRYFNYDDSQDNVYAIPSIEGIKSTIETWAVNKINHSPAPLYIIMVDHGNPKQFFLGKDNITPAVLNTWLNKLEIGLNEIAKNPPRIIIVIGACYSGSFIPKLSRNGRVIVTSAAANERSYKGLTEQDNTRQDNTRSGEFFIEEFFNQLWHGYSLTTAFEKATTSTDIFTRCDSSTNTANPYLDNAMQHPLLDDNGDGKGEHALLIDGDGQKAISIFLGASSDFQTAVLDEYADIIEITPPLYLSESETSAVLFLKANHPHKVDSAQIAIRSPSKILDTQEGSEQIGIDLDTQILNYNSTTDYFEIEYHDFTESGKYEIFYLIREQDTQYISLLQRSVVYKNQPSNSQPEPFELKTPVNESQTRTVLIFDWYSSSDHNDDPITYNLLIAKDENFNIGVKTLTELTSSIAGVDDNIGLTDDTTYYWKVEAIDSFGAKTVSNTRTFKTNDPNDVYTIVNLSIRDDMTYDPILDAQFSVTSTQLPSKISPPYDVISDENSGEYFLGFPIYDDYNIGIDAEAYFFSVKPLKINPQLFSTRKINTKISPQQIIKKHIFLTPCQNVQCYASDTILDKFDKPMADVLVTVDNRTTKTDEKGNWKINGLEEGKYKATAQKEGYIFPSKECFIGNGESCHPDFKHPDSELHPEVVIEQQVEQGDNLNYMVIVTNKGKKRATNIVLTEILPEGTELLAIEALNGGNCNGDTLTCTLSELTPGDIATVKIVISNTQAKRLQNTIIVSSNEYPIDKQVTWTQVNPYLSVSISDTPDPVMDIGKDILHYQLDIKLNRFAPTMATGVKLISQLPKGVELKSISTDNGICDISNMPIITCSLIDLNVAKYDGSHANVSIDVKRQNAQLLLWTHEAKVTANEYPEHADRERTEIFISDDTKADIALVIDVTGSMQEELKSIIKAIEEASTMIAPDTAPLIALVAFTDVVTIKDFTSDLKQMLKTVNGLKAYGGGTCPEASAEALQITIPHIKDGGYIMFATDASPYADTDTEGLIELMHSRGIRFNAMITGDCKQRNSWNTP